MFLKRFLVVFEKVYIFCTIPSVHKITMINNSLFLPKVAPLFHLSVFKAIFIKTLYPILRRQKEFVYNFALLSN